MSTVVDADQRPAIFAGVEGLITASTARSSVPAPWLATSVTADGGAAYAPR